MAQPCRSANDLNLAQDVSIRTVHEVVGLAPSDVRFVRELTPERGEIFLEDFFTARSCGLGHLGSREFKLESLSQNWDTIDVRRVPAPEERPLHWVGSAKRDFLTFPGSIKDDIGNALGIAQFGGKAPTAKPWKGLGPGVLEIVESHDGNAYRAVYTVRFAKAVYVLHAFHKKSPSGIRTAKRDVDLVAERLKQAQRDYEEHYGKAKP
jgi:phage-related protein